MTIISTPKTIAVYVGGDLIGDAIMKLPFVRALRGAWPAAQVTWIAGIHKTALAHELAPLVAGLIDETIEKAGLYSVFQHLLSAPLEGRHFDLLIDTQRGVGRSLLVRRIRHNVFVSGTANFLLSDVKPAKPWTRPKGMVAQLMELVSLAYGDMPPSGPALAKNNDAEHKAVKILPPGRVYVGLAPGAGGQQKRWPLDRYISVGQSVAARGQTPVVILGPGEAALAKEISSAIPDAIVPEEELNAGYLKSPILSIAIARHLSAAVANDAGVGHILAAADTPLVSLFGPTSPEKFAPSTPQLEIIRAQDFGGDKMSLIPETVVRESLEKLLP